MYNTFCVCASSCVLAQKLEQLWRDLLVQLGCLLGRDERVGGAHAPRRALRHDSGGQHCKCKQEHAAEERTLLCGCRLDPSLALLYPPAAPLLP